MSNHVKLGIFVAVVFVVFLYFTLQTGKGLLGGQERYDVYFRNIGTLERGAPVKQAGYNVGHVSEIQPADLIVGATPEKWIKVTVSLSKKAELSIDSEAHIRTYGMMGEMYVEISYGVERRLKPGNPDDFILGTTPFSMENIINQVTDLGDEVKETFDNINKILGQKETQDSFSKIVQNIEHLTRDLDELIGGEKQTLTKTLDNLRDASESLKGTLARANAVVEQASQVLAENRGSLRRTFDNAEKITTTLRGEVLDDVKQISQRLKDVSEDISTMVAKVDRLVDRNEPAVEQTLANLNEASLRAKEAADTLAVIVEDVRTGKGVVGRLFRDEALAVRTETAIQNIGDLVEEASAAVSGSSGLIEKTDDVVSTIRSVPDRFTLLYDLLWYEERDRYGDKDDSNIRNDLILRFDLTDEIFTELGSNQIGDENELDAMFGYRYGPWTARAGVFESEAGLSLDLMLFKRLLFGVRGVGLTEEDKERLDIYGAFQIWDGLSLIGGVEDLADETNTNLGLRYKF